MPPRHSLRYSWLHPSLVAAGRPDGEQGVFALAAVEAGELLAILGGKVMPIEGEISAAHDRTLQIHDFFVLGCAEGEVEDTEFFNHSCEPNAGFKGQILLYAMTGIAAGEEVTFDYATVVFGDTVPYHYEFACQCNKPRCRGRITGNDWRLPELQTRYRGFFQPYLQEKIDRET
jgi:uncharacterized protein